MTQQLVWRVSWWARQCRTGPDQTNEAISTMSRASALLTCSYDDRILESLCSSLLNLEEPDAVQGAGYQAGYGVAVRSVGSDWDRLRTSRRGLSLWAPAQSVRRDTDGIGIPPTDINVDRVCYHVVKSHGSCEE